MSFFFFFVDCGLYTAVDSHSISETEIQRRYKMPKNVVVPKLCTAIDSLAVGRNEVQWRYKYPK